MKKTSIYFFSILVSFITETFSSFGACSIGSDITIPATWVTLPGGSITSTYIVPAGAVLELNSAVYSFTSGRKIIVKADGVLIMTSSTATSEYTCGDMWGGVEVEDGGQVYGWQSDIVNAEFGIHALPSTNTSIDLQDFEFDKTYIGIKVDINGLGNVFPVFNLNHVNFTSIGPLLPPYNLPAAQVGNKTFAGMELNNCNFIINGGSFFNTFSGLNIGIKAQNCNLALENNVFTYITKDPTYGNIYDGSGIFSDGNPFSTSLFQHGLSTIGVYSFEYCDFGIYTNSENLTATENWMDFVTIGIRCTKPDNTVDTIYGNLINCSKYGIDLVDAGTCDYQVNKNEIWVNNNFKTGGTGINISEYLSNSTFTKEVNSNLILIFDGKYGIYILNGHNVYCKSNNIYLYNQSTNLRGIQLESGKYNEIACNYVDCTWFNEKFDLACYGFYKSKDNTISCNYAQSGSVGFLFESDCGSSTGFGNNFMSYNGGRGLLMDQTAIIGPQVDMKNQWLTPSGAISAEHLGPFILSKFYANPGILFNYPPAIVPDPGWFVISTNPFPHECPTDLCSQAIEEGNQNLSAFELLTGDSSEYSLFNREQLLIRKKYFLERINENDIINNQIVDNFYFNPVNNAPRTLVEIEKRYSQNSSLFDLSQSQQVRNGDSIRFLLSDWYSNCQQFHSNSLSSFRDSLIVLNRAIQNRINTIQLTADSLMELKIEQTDDTIREYERLNSLVQSSEDMWENEKIINGIYFAKIYNQEFIQLTTQDEDEVERIANLCKSKGGDALFKARVILNILDPFVQYLDSGNCNSNINSYRIKQEGNFATNTLGVYPIPFSNELNITDNRIGTELVNIEVIDITGRVIFTNEAGFNEGKAVVNFNILQGTYYLKVTSKNIGVQTICILKL